MTDLISNRWYEVGPTQRLDGENFHISYIPHTDQLTPHEITNVLLAGEQERETSLCREAAHFILQGDWRTQYEDRIDEGYDACYQFYQARKVTNISKWSDDYEEKS